MTLRVGIDLDNTLVSYDRVFERLVRERGIVPAAPDKKTVRDAVRRAAGNDVWTELQGLAYGPGMKDAELMPGAENFLKWARDHRIPVCVVSHKTRRSAAGNHDLHAPAVEWLRSKGFLTAEGLGLRLELNREVFLEETREAKFARIGALNLTHFIDDLEEFLTDPAFPAGVERLHYAPDGAAGSNGLRSFQNWTDLQEFFKHEAQRRKN